MTSESTGCGRVVDKRRQSPDDVDDRVGLRRQLLTGRGALLGRGGGLVRDALQGRHRYGQILDATRLLHAGRADAVDQLLDRPRAGGDRFDGSRDLCDAFVAVGGVRYTFVDWLREVVA